MGLIAITINKYESGILVNDRPYELQNNHNKGYKIQKMYSYQTKLASFLIHCNTICLTTNYVYLSLLRIRGDSVLTECMIVQFVGAGFRLLEPISVTQQSIQVYQSDAGIRRGTWTNAQTTTACHHSMNFSMLCALYLPKFCFQEFKNWHVRPLQSVTASTNVTDASTSAYFYFIFSLYIHVYCTIVKILWDPNM